MQRSLAFAGKLYDTEPEKVEALISKLIKVKTAKTKTPQKIIAAVVPHPAINLGKDAYSDIYSELASAEAPETVIIISQSHQAAGNTTAIYPEGSWQTPFGDIAIDEEFVEAMFKHSKTASADSKAHELEHPIELQLPFVKKIYPNAKLVAITMKGIKVINETNDIVNSILNAAYELNRKIIVLATTNLTHYGRKYFNTLHGEVKDAQVKVEKEDKKLIKFIENLKEVDFLKEVIKSKSNMCGYVAVVCAIIYARSLKCKKGRIVNYHFTHPSADDKKSFISYAGIIFGDK